jgi:entericidin B
MTRYAVQVSFLMLSACNTMAGLGEDTAAGGHAITTAAESAKGSGASTAGSGSSMAAAGPVVRVSPATVKQVQTNLHTQGLYHGPIDGVMGNSTHAALARYQQKKGVPQTGQLDYVTLHDLTSTQ